MNHKLHMKLYVRTAKGYPGELNVFGDSGKELAQAIAEVFGAMNLELQTEGVPLTATPTSADSPDHEAEIEAKAAGFLAQCEIHNKKWYDNPSQGGGTFKSHSLKPESGFCQYAKVAKAAWDDLMHQISWSDTEAKGWLEEHFGGKTFSGLSEKDQALAIARLRVGR